MRHGRCFGIIAHIILGVGAFLAFSSSAQAVKTCYDCHQNLKAAFEAKKVVHKPVKDNDCESCHKRHGFANTLILVDNSSELCFTCHADLKEKFAVGTKHAPMEVGKCWDCHEPHAADKKGLLRNYEGVIDDPGSCLACHGKELESALDGTVPHPPFTKLDCAACHDPHNSEHAGLLKKDVSALCADCHDPKDKKTLAAHEGKAIAGLECAECHSGHSTNSAGLMSGNSHAPFSEGQCDVCHAPVTDPAAIQFTDGKKPGELCGECHSEQVDATALAIPHAAVEKVNCDACHQPHSSRHGKLLKENQANLCGECHDDLLTGDKMVAHAPAILGDCSGCHEVHGSNKEHLLAATDSSLCLGCHGEFAVKRDSAEVVHPAIADCNGCHAPHEGHTQAILRTSPEDACRKCHEPSGADRAAESVHPPYLRSDCSACHNSHFGDEAHLVKAGGNKLCVNCHPEIGNRTTLAVQHAPAQEDCQTCHRPHTAGSDFLLAAPEGELCGQCHDRADFNGNKTFVHTPVLKGDCSGCHNPHGSMKEHLVAGRAVRMYVNGIPISKTPALGDKIADLCFTCHDDLKEKFRQGVPHTPVESGDCQVCHDPHGGDVYGMLKDEPAKVCGTCHTIDADLATKHENYDLTAANCLDCHNPHTAPEKGLMRANLHPPFAEKSCDGCHERGADGKVVMAGPEAEVCGTCHEDLLGLASKKSQHGPFAAGECTACHSPHAGDDKKFLLRAGNDLCTNCHSDIHELVNQPVQHRPFADGACVDCHGPHATDNPVLTVKAKEGFCTSCHEDIKKELASGEVHAPTKTGDCTQCHLPHAGAAPMLLAKDKQALCSGCHDYTSVAVKTAHGGFDISGADCQNCHVAHATKRGVKGLLLPNAHEPFRSGTCDQCHAGQAPLPLVAETKELCLTCHDDFAKQLAQAVVHAPILSGDCTGCHGPHVGFGKSLQVREGFKACVTCHDSREFSGSVKHPVAFEDCGNCHDPHAAPNKGLLNTTDIQGLCLGCHEDAKKSHFHPMGDSVIDPRTKTPVNCVSCHSAHSSDWPSMLVADKNRKLCVLCHDVSH